MNNPYSSDIVRVITSRETNCVAQVVHRWEKEVQKNFSQKNTRKEHLGDPGIDG
jgi:hypothetical protein